MIIKYQNLLNIWRRFFHNIFLSLTSVDFYANVYANFKGLGIKHLLTASFVSVIFFSFPVLREVDIATRYFKYNEQVGYANIIEQIFQYMPELVYDGKKIINPALQNQIFYIKDKTHNVGVIDLNSKLREKELKKKNLFFIISNSALKINLKNKEFVINYQYILGTNPITLTSTEIKNYIADLLTSVKNQFFYSTFFMFLIMIPISILVQNIPLVFIIPIVTTLVFNQTFKQGIRIVLFGISGIMVVQSVLFLTAPSLNDLIGSFLSIWIIVLIVKGLIKYSRFLQSVK